MRLSPSRLLAVTLILLLVSVAAPCVAGASVSERSSSKTTATTSSEEEKGGFLYAAKKAEGTGRKIAMSLIALGFAIASIMLAFRRDFKEAAGVLAIGIVAVLLANGTGVSVLSKTVTLLFG